MRGIEMLYKNKGHACIGMQLSYQMCECVKAARRSA